MRKSTREDILTGNIVEQIIIFFIPVFIGFICDQLYNTIDAVVVGKYCGKEALAAVGGTTGTSISLLLNFIWGLTSGITVIIAQYYGKRDYDGVELAVKTGIFLSVVLGASMSILGILVTPGLLSLLNVPTDIYGMSVEYMRVYLAGLIPLMVYNVGAAILRATGDSKRPLLFLIISAFVNIVLDYVFVRFLHLGVKGAAIATIIAQSVCCVLVLITFKNSDDCIRFEIKEFGFDFKILKKALLIGLPAGLTNVIYSISNLFIQASVNAFGTNVVAGYTAFQKIDGFYWNYDSAFGIAAMTLVGQNYGAKKIDRVKETIRKGLIMEAIGSILISVVCYFAAPILINLFTNDEEVIEIGVEILRFLSIGWVLFNPVEIISSACKACGNTFAPMIISAVGICGTRIIYLMLYNYKTVIEALACYPLSWGLTGVVFIIYYLTGKWQRKQI